MKWMTPIIFAAIAGFAQPVLAADNSLYSQVGHAEEVVYGKRSSDGSLQHRLDELEKSVSGKVTQGSVQKRIALINRALGVSSTIAGSKVEPSSARPIEQASSTQSSLPPFAPSRIPRTKSLLQLGAMKFNQGDHFGAETIFRQVLVSDPTNVDALYNLGAISEHRGDLVSALGFYQAALKVNPGDEDLKNAVAFVNQQFSRGAGSHGPLIGGAEFSHDEPQPLFRAEVPQLAPQRPLLGAVPPSYPMLSVGTPQIPQVQAPQPKPMKQAFIGVLHVGLSQVPGMGGMSCPICSMLNKL